LRKSIAAAAVSECPDQLARFRSYPAAGEKRNAHGAGIGICRITDEGSVPSCAQFPLKCTEGKREANAAFSGFPLRAFAPATTSIPAARTNPLQCWLRHQAAACRKN